MRKAFFFDLDGTLLPMDMEMFFQLYFKGVRKSGLFNRISEEQGEEIFSKAVYEMLANDGRALNKDVFFQAIENASGVKSDLLMRYMDRFYDNEFKQVKKSTCTNESVCQIIEELKKKGYRLILATNPVFPRKATDQRIEWAGLLPKDFEYISYYDNSSYCKPNPKYYTEILRNTRLSADECYIVGNDVAEDMSAVALGFKGFLVLDHVIGDIRKVPQCDMGDYSKLLDLVRNLQPI
ncbi:MAG: HAD family hydrolase [Christensenellales bacterium]